MKFTEAQLEAAVMSQLESAGYPHTHGEHLGLPPKAVIIADDLRAFLQRCYAAPVFTAGEIEGTTHVP